MTAASETTDTNPETVVTARWYSDEECWVFDTGDDLADHAPSDHQFVAAVPADIWVRRSAALQAWHDTYDELVLEFGLATDGPWFGSPCDTFVEGRPFEPVEGVDPEFVASIRRWMNCQVCGRPRVYHDGVADPWAECSCRSDPDPQRNLSGIASPGGDDA